VLSGLWIGTDLPKFSSCRYDIQYVEALKRGIERHVTDGELMMLADEFFRPQIEALGIAVIPFSGNDHGGWTRLLEVYQHGAAERRVYMDLDTVLVGNCDWLWDWNESPVGLMYDPYYRPEVCSGVSSFSFEGGQQVWDAGVKAFATKSKELYYMGHPAEMPLLRKMFKDNKWNALELYPRRLLSYKADLIKNGTEWRGASLVYFHGTPKPADLPFEDPIYREWTS